MVPFYAVKGNPIVLGRNGEDKEREIRFDISDWVNDYGAGHAQLAARRHGESEYYLVPITQDGNFAVWTVTAPDVGVVGSTGECELTWASDSGSYVKSETWTTKVLPALNGEQVDAPDISKAWLDVARQEAATVARLAQQTLENAAVAKKSAEVAGNAAVRQPIIQNGTWWVWSIATERYVDTGIATSGNYYSVEVEVLDEFTLQISFVPSDPGMPAIPPSVVSMPQGPKGDQGEQGIQGPIGETGATGPVGPVGPQGAPGVYVGAGDMPDGYFVQVDTDGEVYLPHYAPSVTQPDANTMVVSFTASEPDMPAVAPVTITLPAGPKGATGEQGSVGPQGPQGIQGVQGKTGPAGKDGADGKTPVKGTDYWTAADKQEMVNELTEQVAPVSYTPQTLTEAQKAQARENIGAQKTITGTSGQYVGFDASGNAVACDVKTVETELIGNYDYSKNAPDGTTFEYTPSNNVESYMIGTGTSVGGRVTISWDATQLTQIEFIPWLFKDGVAYKHLLRSIFGTDKDGATGYWNVSDLWTSPGTGSGFLRIGNGFSFDIPDGCTMMVAFRTNTSGGSILPATSEYSLLWSDSNWIMKALPNLIKVTIEKETDNAIEVRNVFSDYYNPAIRGIAHRGYSGFAPENTLVAFRKAREKGFTYAECDVSFTADGVAVLLHDSTVDRTSNGTGGINAMTFDQVRALDFGSWFSDEYAGEQIPSFEEFIILCKRIGLHPYIELKPATISTQAQISSLVAIVKRYGMTDLATWLSSNTSLLEFVKNAYAKARLGYIVEPITDAAITWVTGTKTDDNEVFLMARYAMLTSDSISACVEHSIPIEAWTVDNASTMEAVDPYISGFTSNKLIANVVLYEGAMK